MATKKLKIGRRIVIILLVVLIWSVITPTTLTVNEQVTIQEGDTFQTFLTPLSAWQRTKLKLYLKRKNIPVDQIDVGTYQFSGTYTFPTFIQSVQDGPTQNYIPYTVLEGWSIYDIDYNLVQQDLIPAGAYIDYVTNAAHILTYQQQYTFLPDDIASLEGFLYPDTYHLDANQSVVPQLVRLQLQAFNTKIRQPYQDSMTSFTQKVRADGLSLTFTPYGIITLASVIEKEEKNIANKATVAGIFLRRLAIGMRLDADVTLCYGLQQPYARCTPSYIAQNVNDQNNIYNTRQRGGLPPQPIANPSAETVRELLNYQLTNYLFYLHAPNGQIYYGETLEQHNQNKQQYLR